MVQRVNARVCAADFVFGGADRGPQSAQHDGV
jgi:hypothetical protein